VLMHSPLRVSSALLSAIAKNPSIESVVLYHSTVVSVESLSKFLQQTKSIKSLYIMLDGIDESPEYPMKELEAAFARNKSLDAVTIRGLDEEFVLIQILRGLASHAGRLREVNFAEDGIPSSLVALNAIRYCLEQSKTIEKIQFF
jgi:hypothetical protein